MSRTPSSSPEALATAYLARARQLFDAGRGRVLRRPHDDARADPYFKTLMACYTYGQGGELLEGYDAQGILLNASLAMEAVVPGLVPQLVYYLKKAVKRAEATPEVAARLRAGASRQPAVATV